MLCMWVGSRGRRGGLASFTTKLLIGTFQSIVHRTQGLHRATHKLSVSNGGFPKSHHPRCWCCAVVQ